MQGRRYISPASGERLEEREERTFVSSLTRDVTRRALKPKVQTDDVKK